MVSTRRGFSRSFLALVCMSAVACGDDSDDANSSTPTDTPDASIVDGMVVTPADAYVAPPPDGSLPITNPSSETFFRTNTLTLLAPPMVTKPLGFEVDNTTDANNGLAQAMTADDDGNGFVDLSLLIRFLSATPQSGDGQTTTGGALCPFPLTDNQTCVPEVGFPFQALLQYTNGTDCKLEGTSEVAKGSCFVTSRAPLTMVLPIIGPVPLDEGQVIGTWQGAEIANGKVRGFLPKTVAAQTKLPDQLPEYLTRLTIKPGTPLTDFLSDKTLEKNGDGVDGWWFLLSFTAKPTKFKP